MKILKTYELSYTSSDISESPEKYLQQCHYQSSWGSQQQKLEDHVLQFPLDEERQHYFRPKNQLLRNNC